eukprot:gene10848-22642_t
MVAVLDDSTAVIRTYTTESSSGEPGKGRRIFYFEYCGDLADDGQTGEYAAC